MTRRILLPDVAVGAVGSIRKHGLRYFVAGYFAASYWLGKEARRETRDIDLSVFVEDLSPVAADLGRRGWYVHRDHGASVKLRHPDHPYQLDFFLFGRPLVGPEGTYRADSLLREMWTRARTRQIRGRGVRLARPEDIIALKCVSLLLGYRKPDHFDDIRALAKHARIDRALLARTLRRHGLMDIYRSVVAERPVPDIRPKGFSPAGAAGISK